MVFEKANSLARRVGKSCAKACMLIAVTVYSGLASAAYELNFPTPVTETGRQIYDLHMVIFWICVIIFVLVFGVMFYSIFAHRKSKDYQASTFSHSTSVEVVWTIIPFLILVGMAWPATNVLIEMEDTTKSDLTIKITGYQWKWEYEYLDSGVQFYSTLATPRSQIDRYAGNETEPQGENYLLEVDRELVVPSGRKVRALITANDVIHAWWIPAFGVKKDAIPGYINEIWFNVDEGKEGIYRGQCAELCGKDHAFMPIVVRVVANDEFEAWIAGGGHDANGGTTSGVAESGAEPDAQSTERTVEAGALAATDESEEIADGSQQTADGSQQTADGSQDTLASSAPTAEPIAAKTWTKEELIARGEEVNARCSACHGADGSGTPGIFPAIAGSPVATGDLDAHIDIVMFGRAGTAMTAFSNQLSDEELAAVVTFQRNAYGNDVGDVVLPSDIKAKRK